MTSETYSAGLSVKGATPLHVIAAFDIGSNSIKMSVARLTPEDTVQEFLWRAETTRLGAGIDATGRLAEDRMEASIAALSAFIAEARKFGATRFIAVATEATRIAENGPQFLDRLRTELGIEIETISGEREAELTFAGLDRRIERRGTMVVADIGGASTEIIEAHDGAVTMSASLPVGSGRLTDWSSPADPPTPAELEAMGLAARKDLAVHPWATGSDRLVVIGGTAEYARKLLGHDWPASPREIDSLLERLSSIGSTDLAVAIDASVLRARVLPAGIAIVAALIELTAPVTILGAASGIRTGMLQAALEGKW